MSGTAERVDGRRARGERRREEIIAATLRVVERDGVAGVTHRAVAREGLHWCIQPCHLGDLSSPGTCGIHHDVGA